MQTRHPRRSRRVVRSIVRPEHLLEPVETRTMMSVGLDANGFTRVTPSSDTRTIYVSTSEGSDSNNGLSASSPVKSLAKGASLLRNGSPDWMLLKKGDVWNEAFPGWTKSGRSEQEPMLISSYGSGERPDIKPGSKDAFNSNVAFHDVAMIGLHLDASTRNPNSPDFTGGTGTSYGIRMVGQTRNFLVEDNQIDHFVYDVSLQGYSGYAQNLTFRRNLITDAYDPGQKAQGLYASMVDGLTLDGNVFDHNGWAEDVAGAGATIYGHNIYLYNSTKNVVVRNNIIANASSHGIQARGGGILENNLFLNDPIGALLGGGPVAVGGVTGRVSGNVFVGSRGIGSMTRGWAIEVSNIKGGTGGGAVISDNVITSDTQNAFPAIRLESVGGGIGLNDVAIERNIVYKWNQGLGISSTLVPGITGSTGLSDLVVRDNDFQNTTAQKIVSHASAFSSAEESWSGNRYNNSKSSAAWFTMQGATTSLDSWKSKVESSASGAAAAYPDPTRTVATYNASLGGSNSADSFLSEARKQSKANFRSQFTAAGAIDYIRGGFTGVVKDGGSGTTNTVPTPTVPTTPTPTVPQPTVGNQAPTAMLIAADRSLGGLATYQFKVRYSDDTAVQVNSFGNLDIRVIGPNGFSQAATFVSADSSTNGAVRTATYQIIAPDGAWDAGDVGTYTISLNANGVKDTTGLYAAAQTLGTFQVS